MRPVPLVNIPRSLLLSNQDRNPKVGIGKENWKGRASGTVEVRIF